MTHTVLIVDDSLTVRMDLADAFTAAGFRPVPCATAAEARATLLDGHVDAIVLDVLLPDANGVDLLHEIRATPAGSNVSVVMLSSEVEVADRIRGLRTGADEYVGKPYDADFLVAKVEKLVRASRGFPNAPSITADFETNVTTILVIDDSATYRDALRQALTAAGYGVLDAISGEEGLRIAATRRPDAILVDGVLPGIDGASVIRHLRLDAVLRDVPCLLLTASEGTGAELRALDAGADAFVHKEENLDVILVRLAAMLRQSPTKPIAGADAKTLLGLKKILAVDDSLTYLYTLGDALKSEGYDVILAHSGEEALALLAVQEVDCILLDMLMPGLTGQETCRRIKAAPAVRDIPLIMLTALDDREAMIQGLTAGADDYISKSSELEVLRARVRAQIRRKQFEDENRRVREELLRQQHEASEARAARELAETKALLVDELERKNKELEAFSYSVSHDLRAPLRAINGFSHVLLEDFGPTLAPEAHDSLQRITAAAHRMSALIDDLLDLSRVALADLKRGSVDLSAMARGVIEGLRRDSDRQVDVVIAEGLVVEADRRLMEVALQNLLGNSWKFTAKAEQPRIEVGCAAGTVDLGSVDPAGGVTTYFVRDNGAGFDMASVERLFQPFRRLHAESEFPGTGIGLATVSRIFERHGGRVWADGAVGRGATFYFTIPPDRYGRTVVSAPVAPIVAKAKVPLRLLLVEDNDDDALLLLRELDRGGYAVNCTRVDTLDGLHGAFGADEWQLVVSDFSLPTMTAHDVLTLLGTAWPDLPCIVISGTITEEAASDVLRAGARDFIVKERMARLLPAIGRELKEAVERRQRRETEKTLQETRERMQFALDSVGIGTWETDVRTGRAIWSDVVERLHGLRPGTFGGTLEAFMALVHAEDHQAVLEHMARLRRDRRDSRIEYRTEWPDGSQHWILSIGRTFWDAHDEPERAVGVSLDITPQKRLEEQIRQSQKMESIGNLAGGIAHDFNNLLTVITGCCELAAESLPARSPAADPLDQIRSAAISAAGLTRQLLTFSRRQIVSPRLINLNTVVTAFASILRRLVEENIRIDFRLAPHLPFVRVDQGQMEQVLLNLVANGRDAMPDGGAISIESSHATVDADYDRIQPGLTPGPYVILAVSDNGSGMTPEVQAHLFEPFFTTKPRGRGTGLGLPTVYGIVKQSGGHISAYSEPGIGTTFRIYLPVAQPDGAEAPVIEEKAASKPVALTGSETVLVVEDNPLLRRLNEQILHQYGYKVLLAGDGAQAQRLCNDHDGPIHVVIMDVVMPGESGPAVGEWIAQQRTQTKIIYMSGYAGEGLDRSRILASGSVFLQKPFTGAQLARAIRDVLAP